MKSETYLEKLIKGPARLEPKIKALWAYTRGTPFDPKDPYEVFIFYVYKDPILFQDPNEVCKFTLDFHAKYLKGIKDVMIGVVNIHTTLVDYEKQFLLPKEAEKIWERSSDKRAMEIDNESD